jgi:catechol 2,3-dioxygenase-like lactoylglutathione lyase family enzyme
MKLPSLLLLTFWIASPVHAEPHRPKITAIASARIFVSDARNSSNFYGHFLPFYAVTAKLSEAGEECLWCEKPPVDWAPGSSPRSPLLPIQLVRVPASAPSDLIDEILLSTNDTEAMRKYLVSRNVRVQPTHGKMNTELRIVDPEGHSVGFVDEKETQYSTHAIYGGRWKLIHAGFVVRDRAAEDKFYKDILGFHVYWHGGMKDGEDNWVDMQVPDGTDWIEYMLGVSPNASHKTLGVMNHIALGVPDIHAAQAQLIKNGFKPTEEPKIGRDGKWQLNLYDPDETRVELMEFKPTEKPCCSDYTGPHPHP